MKYSILLGGIGGDSHSVGLTILHNSLKSNGYTVKYLGTQNQFSDFFCCFNQFNIVMISNMDGHAEYYLREMTKYRTEISNSSTVWLLGGNVAVNKTKDTEDQFKQLGFDYVFIDFVDIKTVLEKIDCILNGVGKLPFVEQVLKISHNYTATPKKAILSKYSNKNFFSEREAVLKTWKTGAEAADFADNAKFLMAQPNLAIKMREHNYSSPLIQPRSGVWNLQQQVELFQNFKDAGCHVLSYQIDSLTRNNNYEAIENSIFSSTFGGNKSLNGFPLINHGVIAARHIQKAIQMPLQTRHSTRDPRLLAEISFASGVTSFEGGAICYNIPYYKNYSLSDSLLKWRYVDNLTGYYYKEFGIVLDREFFGTLTATLIPPSLAIIVNILQSLLAAAAGVKSLTLGYAEQGNRIQDIAAIRSLEKLTREILNENGYHDVTVNTIFHQYMAAFPRDIDESSKLIYQSAQTAFLAKATRIIVKTPVESTRIPSCADNCDAIRLVSEAFDNAIGLTCDWIAVENEMEIIAAEVFAMYKKIKEIGNNDIARGVVQAFNKGILDIPFSPSVFNAGKVVTARDLSGAVRFIDVGNLPFTDEIKAFHNECMVARCNMLNISLEKAKYLLVEQDVLEVARSKKLSWPLSGSITGVNREIRKKVYA